MKKLIPKGFAVCFLIWLSFPDLNAQLMTSVQDPAIVVQNELAAGVNNISNISYNGVYFSIGYFYNGANTNLGLSSGIIMTTGTINSNQSGPLGPNNLIGAGMDLGTGGPPAPVGQWLAAQVNGPSYHDAAVLSFDLLPSGNTVSFRYVFGSEEYNEYVNTDFNDAFAFFLEGPGFPDGYINMVKVPGTNDPVSINTVNNGYSAGCTPGVGATNSQFFVDNCNGQTIQYDGFTTVLTATATVTPLSTYRCYIVITDVGDGEYDSGLFIESYSLVSSINESLGGSYSLVYPVPAMDFVFISGLKESTKVSIWDISGKCVSNQLYDPAASAGISVSDLRPGVYFIEYVSDGANLRRKIIKQ